MLSTVVLAVVVLCHGAVELVAMPTREAPKPHERRLIVVSLDGFRHDYFKLYPTAKMPHLRAFQDRSAWSVNGLRNQFVTATMPNHVTLVTGVEVERHGMVMNEMYDPLFNETFTAWGSVVGIDDGNMTKGTKWFEDAAEPVWVTNQRNGNHSGAMLWPFTSFAYQNETITYRTTRNLTVTYDDRVDDFIGWFTRADKPINFGLLYFEEPDHHGHMYGPNNTALIPILEKLDVAIGRLLLKIEQKLGFENTYVIITSDHGMAEERADTRIPVVKPFADGILKYFIGSMFLENLTETAKVQAMEALASQSDHMKMYMKEEFMPYYGYKHHRRIGDVVVMLDEGRYLSFKNGTSALGGDEVQRGTDPNSINVPPQHSPYFTEEELSPGVKAGTWGSHGYDPGYNSMWPLFMMTGPTIREGISLPQINNTVVYCVMCLILDLNCHYENCPAPLFHGGEGLSATDVEGRPMRPWLEAFNHEVDRDIIKRRLPCLSDGTCGRREAGSEASDWRLTTGSLVGLCLAVAVLSMAVMFGLLQLMRTRHPGSPHASMMAVPVKQTQPPPVDETVAADTKKDATKLQPPKTLRKRGGGTRALQLSKSYTDFNYKRM